MNVIQHNISIIQVTWFDAYGGQGKQYYEYNHPDSYAKHHEKKYPHLTNRNSIVVEDQKTQKLLFSFGVVNQIFQSRKCNKARIQRDFCGAQKTQNVLFCCCMFCAFYLSYLKMIYMYTFFISRKCLSDHVSILYCKFIQIHSAQCHV